MACMSSHLAPIVVFVYNRPEHTKKTLLSLAGNALAGDSPLIIYSDAPKIEAHEARVLEVRDFISHLSGFKSIEVIYQTQNQGLSKSIVAGVTAVVNHYGKAIVLEDDLVSSPFFLDFMNEGLTRYSQDEKVYAISGYNYPLKANLPSSYFIRGADCWGWGTWKRAWDQFNPDGQFLLDELKRRKLKRAFNLNNSYDYIQMLAHQIQAKNDSWAIRWHASVFLNDGLTLFPNPSLIQNIGMDGSGVHGDVSDSFNAPFSDQPVLISDGPIVELSDGVKALSRFWKRRHATLWTRISALWG